MYALFTAIPLVGHINPLLYQAKELRRRGWRVAFAGFSDVRDHVLSEAPDVAFVDLGELGSLRNGLRAAMGTASIDPNFVRGTLRITRAVMSLWPSMFDGLKRVVAADRPDVMVVDMFSSAGLAVADAAKIPSVVNNPDLLGVVPVTLLPPADHLPFLFSGRSARDIPWHQRAFSGLLLRKFAAAMVSLTTDRELAALWKSRGLRPTTVHGLLSNRPILVNGFFPLEYERPLPANVVMVGPMLPDAIPPLDDELRTWLDNGLPVVYVNLGTLAVAPPEQLAKMEEAFDSPKFRCLWNVRMGWGPPPMAILAHPNVKVFVSHCGINSAHESVKAGTPVVGIPMFADQRDMAVRLSDAGIGLWLDKTRFTANNLREAIEKVLEDAAFTRNMASLQEAMFNAGGVQRAVELIEFVTYQHRASKC